MPARQLRALLVRAAAGQLPRQSELARLPAAIRERTAERVSWLVAIHAAGDPTRARVEAEHHTAAILATRAAPPATTAVPVGIAEFIEALLRAD